MPSVPLLTLRLEAVTAGGVRARFPVISTVCCVTGTPHQVSSRGWRLSAVLVGLLAIPVAGWATKALDINGELFLLVWLAIAVGFIGVATLILVPRARSQSRRRPPADVDRS
jgi:uncharacterized membrane protein HdeD (DUF308 family)